MAEICLDCWNELNGTNHPESKSVMSDELCLCEDCGEYKKVIIVERSWFSSKFIKLLNLFNK